MKSLLYQRLAPPVFKDDEGKTWRASLLNAAIITALLIIALGIIGNLIGGRIQAPVYIIESTMFAVVILLRRLLFNGKVSLAGILLVSLGIVFITADIASLGTIRTPGIAAYLLMVIIAGLLFGQKGLVLSIVSSSLAVLGLILCENAGILPYPDYYVNITQWITYSVLTGLTGALTYFSYKSLRRVVDRMCREIDRRKAIEKDLKKTTKLLQSIMDNATDEIIMTTDRTGIVLIWNEGARRLLGYKPEEVVGRKSIGMFHTEAYRTSRRLDAEIKEMVATGKSLTQELDYVTKDGRLVPVQEIVSPCFDGNGRFTGMVTMARDITERNRAEEKLRESEAKFRDLVENIDEVIYTLDRKGRVTYISPAIEARSGYNRQELIGRSIADFIYHEDLPRLMEQFSKVLSGHLEPNEYRLMAKSGERFWIRASSRPVYEGDRVVGVRGVMTDISESKRLQTQLLQSHKMESIGTLAGGVAHDFNNLLYMITGNAELALEDIPEGHPVYENLEEIKVAGFRAAGIVKQLLNFSRKADQELKPIGAVTVIRDALNFLRSTIPATVEIHKHLPDTDVTIFADPIQINQVLMNICTNASQAMEKTGGVLEIGVENESLAEDVLGNNPDLAAGDYIKITVRDTGPGIDPEIIDRIFDPYFTTKVIGKGSGMGLAVVHGIVKNHGGAIMVDSQPGKGATFTIYFPVVDEKPLKEVATSDELPRGDETILFIDDEEPIVNMTKMMLGRLGYTVETKINPVEALALFQTNPEHFDLVITDMTMPQMTGVRLSEKIKEYRPDIPVIICTGHSSQIDGESAKTLGITDYIIKPIAKKDIAKVIRKALDKLTW